MSLLNLVLFVFVIGVMLGTIVCRLRDDAKLALYRRFIEDRLRLQFPVF